MILENLTKEQLIEMVKPNLVQATKDYKNEYGGTLFNAGEWYRYRFGPGLRIHVILDSGYEIILFASEAMEYLEEYV